MVGSAARRIDGCACDTQSMSWRRRGTISSWNCQPFSFIETPTIHQKHAMQCVNTRKKTTTESIRIARAAVSMSSFLRSRKMRSIRGILASPSELVPAALPVRRSNGTVASRSKKNHVHRYLRAMSVGSISNVPSPFTKAVRKLMRRSQKKKTSTKRSNMEMEMCFSYRKHTSMGTDTALYSTNTMRAQSHEILYG